MTQPNVIWFENITIADVPVVGGKNASLGEMVRELGKDGVRVPSGYATSASAYRDFLAANGLEPVMRDRIRRYHAGESSLQETGEAIRQLILASRFPEAVVSEILAAYDNLAERLGGNEPAVAVRSSATAEDLPSASFAGQQETFLNIRGHQALLDACLRCYASLFTDRAISYREAQGIDHLSVALSIGVQQMVRADLAGSGVIFTIDTETGFPRVAIVSAAWGLGETVVQGAVEPDRYLLFKPLLQKEGIRPIIGKACGAKAIRMIYAGDQASEAGANGAQRTCIVATPPEDQARFVLSDDEVLELGRWALSVELHYGRAMDIEWAKDGETGLLYLVQARPETVQSARKTSTFANYRLNAKAQPILTGAAVGSAIGAGKACVIREAADIGRFPPGAVLVTGNTDPDWVPVMKLAAG
ncbi:MAG: phosphoenolpyruvate synthase, partial [Sphingomonadales bacterium]|nr:phosphoenolpyruvate synthase [Sphingomonadales bacterium]